MAYFWKGTNGSERAAKILADIVCAALILVFAIIFFGPAGGLLAFVILEGALLSVDYLVPNEEDRSGTGVR
ncbi:MAG: hypothetical protein ACJ8FZ_01405 [Bradyrhizobium sp.]|jgi:hypothetical protein